MVYSMPQKMKSGDQSKFIDGAVRWRGFYRIVQDIKVRNADANPNELQQIVEEAVSEVRAGSSRFA